MQQVPADRVIAELATKIGELSRELAICRVQIALYNEATPVAADPATPTVNPAPTLA